MNADGARLNDSPKFGTAHDSVVQILRGYRHGILFHRSRLPGQGVASSWFTVRLASTARWQLGTPMLLQSKLSMCGAIRQVRSNQRLQAPAQR